MTLILDERVAEIESEKVEFVPLSEAQIQRASQPAHGRVACADCGHQINPANPRQAVRTKGGFLCRSCASELNES